MRCSSSGSALATAPTDRSRPSAPPHARAAAARPRGLRRRTRLIDAARAAGADLVLLSVIGPATAYTELWVELLSRTRLVFGRGRNPINFVSVHDVAAVVAGAATDRSVRGRSFRIGGPEDLTFDDLARLIDDRRAPRHVPRAVLRAANATIGRVQHGAGRQLRAALVMDEADMTFDGAAARRDLPWPVPLTTAAAVVARTAPRAARASAAEAESGLDQPDVL